MKIFRRSLLASVAALSVLAAVPAQAQTVTLRLHQFLPPQAVIPAKAIVPWAKKVEAESGGRIKIQLFQQDLEKRNEVVPIQSTACRTEPAKIQVVDDRGRDASPSKTGAKLISASDGQPWRQEDNQRAWCLTTCRLTPVIQDACTSTSLLR